MTTYDCLIYPDARLAVRYGTVRNYGTIYFPRYGMVRKYDIFVRTFIEPFSYQLNYRVQTTKVC